MPSHTGSCHCQRVRFRVHAEITAATVCNCSMCTKKGIVHLILERSQFELLSGAEDLTSYKFNTCIADHTFCKHCGIHPFYTPRSDPDKVDVNLRCVDGLDLGTLEIEYFDGQHWEAAIHTARWQQQSGE